MKGLKIFNIILFSIICVLEVLIFGTFINTLLGLFSNSFAGVFEVLFSLVYFLIGSGILFVLAIVITITARVKINKEETQGLTKTKFDKLCIILPWAFLFLNVALFITINIISTIKTSK